MSELMQEAGFLSRSTSVSLMLQGDLPSASAAAAASPVSASSAASGLQPSASSLSPLSSSAVSSASLYTAEPAGFFSQPSKFPPLSRQQSLELYYSTAQSSSFSLSELSSGQLLRAASFQSLGMEDDSLFSSLYDSSLYAVIGDDDDRQSAAGAAYPPASRTLSSDSVDSSDGGFDVLSPLTPSSDMSLSESVDSELSTSSYSASSTPPELEYSAAPASRWLPAAFSSSFSSSFSSYSQRSNTASGSALFSASAPLPFASKEQPMAFYPSAVLPSSLSSSQSSSCPVLPLPTTVPVTYAFDYHYNTTDGSSGGEDEEQRERRREPSHPQQQQQRRHGRREAADMRPAETSPSSSHRGVTQSPSMTASASSSSSSTSPSASYSPNSSATTSPSVISPKSLLLALSTPRTAAPSASSSASSHRQLASSSSQETSRASTPVVPDPDEIVIGKYTRAERAAKIARYREKRARRQWGKKIMYGCRKSFADNRPRVGGRFIKMKNSDADSSNKDGQ